MSLEKDGFLSGDIDGVRLKYRAAFPEIIGFVTELSGLAQSMIPSIDGQPRTLKNLFVSAYFIRALQNCQGAMLLAERGMFTEAYTLVRSGLETVFYLGAATREKDFAREMGRDHVKRTRATVEGHIKGMKELAPDSDETELRSALDAVLAQGLEPEALFIQAVARKAELTPLYDTLYRQLSNGYAHPTLSSLNMIWELDEDGMPYGIMWGPERGEEDEIETVLTMNFSILHQLIFEWLRFKQDASVDQRLGEIGGRYTIWLNARSA